MKAKEKEREQENRSGGDPLLPMSEVCARTRRLVPVVRLRPASVWGALPIRSWSLVCALAECGPRNWINGWLGVCARRSRRCPRYVTLIGPPAWPPAQHVPVRCSRDPDESSAQWSSLCCRARPSNHLYRLLTLADPAFRFPWPAPMGVRARRWAMHVGTCAGSVVAGSSHGATGQGTKSVDLWTFPCDSDHPDGPPHIARLSLVWRRPQLPGLRDRRSSAGSVLFPSTTITHDPGWVLCGSVLAANVSFELKMQFPYNGLRSVYVSYPRFGGERHTVGSNRGQHVGLSPLWRGTPPAVSGCALRQPRA